MVCGGEQLILWENDRNRVTYAKAVLYDNFTSKVGQGGGSRVSWGCEGLCFRRPRSVVNASVGAIMIVLIYSHRYF